jgi:hypothetical protein
MEEHVRPRGVEVELCCYLQEAEEDRAVLDQGLIHLD